LKLDRQDLHNNYYPASFDKDINLEFRTVEGKLDTQLISRASISHCLLKLISAWYKTAATSKRISQNPAKT
jgi:hypothetical protein